MGVNDPELEHDWFDPGEKYPNLRMTSRLTGEVLLSCKRCGVMKGPVSSTRRCPGPVRVELR